MRSHIERAQGWRRAPASAMLPHMNKALMLVAGAAVAAVAEDTKFDGKRPVAFERQVISTNRFEAASLFDINKDGHTDIFCGDAWYAGPAFTNRGVAGPVAVFHDYHEDFAALPLDVDGDGFTDVVTGGWFTGKIRWRRNPQGDPAQPWAEAVLGDVGAMETVLGWDLDGDGRPELVANCPNHPQRALKQKVGSDGKPQPAFDLVTLSPDKMDHGLGCGDVNGDGRPDLVFRHGWLENPGGPLGATNWTRHEEFSLGSASVPIIVTDVNGDQRADLVVGQAHSYGLDWWEQRQENGQRAWTKHAIDPLCSQFHFLAWADVDRDGKSELVAGKRRHAHRDKDPGDADPAGIYYYKWTGAGFTKVVVDYGVKESGKGCGIYFEVADATGDGWPDIIAPGKDGLFLYRNLGHLNPR
jgi:hypothetical protein